MHISGQDSIDVNLKSQGVRDMKQLPLTSIIIPTYNDGKVVSDAIDSSLNQTYENIEIIVVDDGSNDGTEHLLKEKYGKSIKYIRQENHGLSSARNAGIRHASGKYIQFLDADDVIDRTKIKLQVESLQDVSGVALAYCDYVRTSLDDQNMTYRRMSPVLQENNPFDDMIMKWETEVSIPPHCFLFDASLFKAHGIVFDESLPTHEDWECWVNVFALNPEVVFIDRPLADYRVRSNSMCANNLKMRNGYLMAINKQIKKFAGNNDIVMKLKTRRKQIKYLYREASPIMRVLGRCHPVVRRKFFELVPWRIQRMLDLTAVTP